MGTPPKGSETSAVAAVARACSSSTKHTALSDEPAMAASDASSASVGEMVPARKAIDERAGVFHPWLVAHGPDATGSTRHPAPPWGACLASALAAALACSPLDAC